MVVYNGIRAHRIRIPWAPNTQVGPGKIVRSGIPGAIEEAGCDPLLRRLRSRKEFTHLLGAKLREEARELRGAGEGGYRGLRAPWVVLQFADLAADVGGRHVLR